MNRPDLPPIEPRVRDAVYRAVAEEPFARTLEMELVALENGYSEVEMVYNPSAMDNLFSRAHGGALYALIDEAFETAGQSDGTVAVALNVNVTYVASPEPGARLRAVARIVSRTKKTAGYEIRVTGPGNRLIASCQALAFRTEKPLPFLSPPDGPKRP